MSANDYQEYLRTLLESRKLKNSSYSLRSFSRDLGLTPSRVSLILQGKQGLSLSRAQKVSSLLGLKFEEAERFCNLVQVKHARIKKNREQPRNDLQKNKYQLIDPEETQFVMDWVHSA